MTLTSEDAGCSSLRACDGAAVSAALRPGPAGDSAGAGPAERDTRRYRCLPAGQPPAASRQEPSGPSVGIATTAENAQICGPGDRPARLPLLSQASPAPAVAAPPRGLAHLSVVVEATNLVPGTTPAVEAPPLPLWPRPHPWPSL